MEDPLANHDTLLSAAEAQLEALERERAVLLESINQLRAQQGARPEAPKVNGAPAASSSILSSRMFPQGAGQPRFTSK